MIVCKLEVMMDAGSNASSGLQHAIVWRILGWRSTVYATFIGHVCPDHTPLMLSPLYSFLTRL